MSNFAKMFRDQRRVYKIHERETGREIGFALLEPSVALPDPGDISLVRMQKESILGEIRRDATDSVEDTGEMGTERLKLMGQVIDQEKERLVGGGGREQLAVDLSLSTSSPPLSPAPTVSEKLTMEEFELSAGYQKVSNIPLQDEITLESTISMKESNEQEISHVTMSHLHTYMEKKTDTNENINTIGRSDMGEIHIIPSKKNNPMMTVKDLALQMLQTRTNSKEHVKQEVWGMDGENINNYKNEHSVKYDLYKCPGEQGWVREAIINNNELCHIIYWSPPDFRGKKTKFTKMKELLNYLGDSSRLTRRNFNFGCRLLGLGEPYEVTRRSAASVKRKSIFASFYTDDETIDPERRMNPDGTLNKNRRISCNLCSQLVIFGTFAKHMRNLHLPDETCSKCGVDFPSGKILAHFKICKG